VDPRQCSRDGFERRPSCLAFSFLATYLLFPSFRKRRPSPIPLTTSTIRSFPGQYGLHALPPRNLSFAPICQAVSFGGFLISEYPAHGLLRGVYSFLIERLASRLGTSCTRYKSYLQADAINGGLEIMLSLVTMNANTDRNLICCPNVLLCNPQSPLPKVAVCNVRCSNVWHSFTLFHAPS
jgi:hypothetical protein